MGWDEYWRIAVIVGSGLPVLLLRRRVPRWVTAAWGLLVAAVVLAWAVDLSWLGTLVFFCGLVFIAGAFWLRAEERWALEQQEQGVSPPARTPPA